MPILLNSSGQRVLNTSGAVRVGASGDPCCCGGTDPGDPAPCTCTDPAVAIRTLTLDYDLVVVESGIVTRDEHVTQTFVQQEQGGEWVCEWWGDWVPDVFAARVSIPAIYLQACTAWAFGDGYANQTGGSKATGSTPRGTYTDKTTDLYNDGTYMIYRTNIVVT